MLGELLGELLGASTYHPYPDLQYLITACDV